MIKSLGYLDAPLSLLHTVIIVHNLLNSAAVQISLSCETAYVTVCQLSFALTNQLILVHTGYIDFHI